MLCRSVLKKYAEKRYFTQNDTTIYAIYNNYSTLFRLSRWVEYVFADTV